jgi:hypothetical protein
MRLNAKFLVFCWQADILIRLARDSAFKAYLGASSEVLKGECLGKNPGQMIIDYCIACNAITGYLVRT